ncbi:hypothetical protein E3U55_12245 [Filobacillus milosensis]|uniref:Uncharacterized protein n=1 Tax=Filobacillus milosensis TaxID=94137 RepID=A0A4Y8IEQ0_9BACI|nr:hypothetical protein [Filobacillus milosensis]TFB15020.1 hypothetical protein E3U55_12245 [Filobacillus milosensis]
MSERKLLIIIGIVGLTLVVGMIIFQQLPPKHEPINTKNVMAIHISTHTEKDIKMVDSDKYMEVVELFNEHPVEQTSSMEENPRSEASIIIDAESPSQGRETIILNYTENGIFVERTDTGNPDKYVLVDVEDRLNDVFKKIIISNE